MRISDFELYCDIMRDRAGRFLDTKDSYVVESRLAPVAKKWGYPSVAAMTPRLLGVPDEEIIIDIVEAMTDSETSFFRDQKAFTLLATKVIPYLIKARKKKALRIWSAAAGTGQEPYSLAIVLKEVANAHSAFQGSILASDISERALDKARKGLYSQFEVQQGVPIKTLLAHFEKQGNSWQVNPEIRKLVTFHLFNLLDDMQPLGTFDVILCRNVLSTMEKDIAEDILEKLSQIIAPDGFLVMGQGEDPGNLFTLLDKPGCLYCRADSPHAR